jgi:hypothetical protein
VQTMAILWTPPKPSYCHQQKVSCRVHNVVFVLSMCDLQRPQCAGLHALEVVGCLDCLQCDFMCLAPIRILLKDHGFKSVEDVMAVMVQWFL